MNQTFLILGYNTTLDFSQSSVTSVGKFALVSTAPPVTPTYNGRSNFFAFF
jgi:hypothetical protein